MATASTPAWAERVLRVAISQVRGLPTWSVYSIFWRAIHLDSDVGRSETRVMTGSWILVVIVKGRRWARGGVVGDGGERRVAGRSRRLRERIPLMCWFRF